MQTEIILLSVCLICILLLIVFRKNPFVKKYWKYSLILLPGIVILVLKIILVVRQKPESSNQSPLKDEVLNIKEKLNEVNTIAKIEASVAKEKNEIKMKELQEVQKISDARERRKRLAQMIG